MGRGGDGVRPPGLLSEVEDLGAGGRVHAQVGLALELGDPELGAAVLRAALFFAVVGDGLLLAEADRDQALLRNALVHQPLLDGEGALAGELLVVAGLAHVVGMTFDAELGHLGVLVEEELELVEHDLAARALLESRLLGVEHDVARDRDSVTLHGGVALLRRRGRVGGRRRGRRGRRLGGGRWRCLSARLGLSRPLGRHRASREISQSYERQRQSSVSHVFLRRPVAPSAPGSAALWPQAVIQFTR